MSNEKELSIFKGTSVGYELIFTEDNLPIDITGWTVYFTVKEKMEDPDSSAAISKEITTHEDPTAGISVIELSNVDTDISSGSYYYSIDYKDTDDNTKVVLHGRIRVMDSVRDSH